MSTIKRSPSSPKAPKRLHLGAPPAMPPAPSKKRENTFSKSKDIREDRGSRQMKTSHNPQTIPHGRP